MSISAIIFLIIYLSGIIATFYNPVFGVMTYIYEWHNAPAQNWWGKDLPDLRYSFIIAIVTLLSTILNRNKLKGLTFSNFGPGLWLVILTIWMYMVSYGWAIVPEDSLRRAEEFFKITIFYFLLIYVIRERKHYHWFIWTILVNVANFGRISYIYGKNRYLKIRAPNATEENAISGYVASTFPFYGTKFLKSKKWGKMFILLVMPFLVNLLILANSRGAFLAVIVIALVGLILFPLKDKVKIILVIIGCLLLILILANEDFWKRQSTTIEYERDTSAMSRFYLWNAGLRMMHDYPFGVGAEGPEKLMIDYLEKDERARYEAEHERRRGGKTVHNTFLLVGVEWGYPGFILFILFLIHVYIILRRIKRALKISPDLMDYYFHETIAVQLAILGILTAGFFTNRLYTETIYWYCALISVLLNIINNEIEQMKNENENPNYYATEIN